MHKIALFFSAVITVVFCSCDAPNVVNQDIQKELSNRKVRHITQEDEELFGLMYTDEVLNELAQKGFTKPLIDSVNKEKGFALLLVDASNKKDQAEEIASQMDMFIYNYERELDLAASANYFSKGEQPFYYCTKAIVTDNTVSGFWLLKIDAVTVRQNMPDA